MGLLYAPLSLVTLREAPEGGQGAATSALQLSDILGTSLGTGIGGGILAAGVRGGVPQGTSLAITFGVAVAAAIGGLLLATRLPGARRGEVAASAPDGAPSPESQLGRDPRMATGAAVTRRTQRTVSADGPEACGRLRVP